MNDYIYVISRVSNKLDIWQLNDCGDKNRQGIWHR